MLACSCTTLHAGIKHLQVAGVCRRSKVNWMLALRYLPCKEKAFDLSADTCLQFSFVLRRLTTPATVAFS